MNADQLIPLATSVITIYGMWQAANLKQRAWVLGIANQALWLWFIIVFEAWGLIPLNIAMVFVYSRNLILWRRKEIGGTDSP